MNVWEEIAVETANVKLGLMIILVIASMDLLERIVKQVKAIFNFLCMYYSTQ